jgi:hypothetical protein
MFVPAPIDKNFVPYTKRPVLRRNAGLFVDATVAEGSGAPRVVPQVISCAGKPDCTPCHRFPDGTQLYCLNGECVGTERDCPR